MVPISLKTGGIFKVSVLPPGVQGCGFTTGSNFCNNMPSIYFLVTWFKLGHNDLLESSCSYASVSLVMSSALHYCP